MRQQLQLRGNLYPFAFACICFASMILITALENNHRIIVIKSHLNILYQRSYFIYDVKARYMTV